jgi:hypothetical protein
VVDASGNLSTKQKTVQMPMDQTTATSLRGAIQAAYPTVGELRMLVSDVLGAKLQDISSLNQPIPQLVFELFEWCESNGKLDEFLRGASKHNPGNPKLRAAMALLEENQYLGMGTTPTKNFLDSLSINTNNIKTNTRFIFNYSFEPEPGKREWEKIEHSIWIERYGSGHITKFEIITDNATVNEVNGHIVRKIEGDYTKALVEDYIFEVFIPRKYSNSHWLMMRHMQDKKWLDWTFFAEIEWK